MRSAAQGFNWETKKYKGADYVTLRSVKAFYYFNKISYGSVITMENSKVRLEFRPGTQRCRMNGVLFILSHPVVSSGGRYLLSRTDLVKLVDPVMRPTYIQNARPFNTVVVDAGHGGKDPGSLGFYGNEKGYTLKVARMVRDMLQKRRYKVVMTRDSDVFISLRNRVRIANKYPNAVFLSIHFNSGNSRANGVETFTISPVGVPHMGRGVRPRDFRMVPGNIMDSASIALATAVHSRTLLNLNRNNFRIDDRGIKRARFNVLTGIKIPAILVEGGFLSNRKEAAKVHTSAYQQTLAASIVMAVDVYRKSIQAKR
ncbi:MAG: N-acetylmuramoyl-L-alanine amidase [Verrucomicrobiae bacterium]|nr:N-acetylmuramoyl-L-alanine amidase [Verrucomicrobiae bacterium]NNJ86124.1 N-acetylmuramoyl-L-alanine amidase [Akkermansiaceae bacterium]